MKTPFYRCVFLLGLLAQTNPLLAQTQSEMSGEACDEYKKIDSDLNQTYKNVLSQYKDDKIFISKFMDAQRKWLLFRDAHLGSIYPNIQQNYYGTINPMCRCTILADLTHIRLRQIRVWVNGMDEGDACRGSIKRTA